jgi:hypothetical protein
LTFGSLFARPDSIQRKDLREVIVTTPSPVPSWISTFMSENSSISARIVAPPGPITLPIAACFWGVRLGVEDESFLRLRARL